MQKDPHSLEKEATPLKDLRAKINHADEDIIEAVALRYHSGFIEENAVQSAINQASRQGFPESFIRNTYEILVNSVVENKIQPKNDLNVVVLDGNLLTALANRRALQPEIVGVKIAHNIPLIVPARVEEVFKNAAEKGLKKDLPTKLTNELYGLILEDAHEYQHELSLEHTKQMPGPR